MTKPQLTEWQKLEAVIGDIPDFDAMSGEEWEQWAKNTNNRIATALEEQKKELLAEVEGWLVDEDAPKEAEQVFSLTEDALDAATRAVEVHANNRLRAELRTKLNQLKGNNEKTD